MTTTRPRAIPERFDSVSVPTSLKVYGGFSGLVLSDLDQVKRALSAIETGAVYGANASVLHDVKAFSEQGPNASALFAASSYRTPEGVITQDIMKRAGPKLKKGEAADIDYDWWGPGGQLAGNFHKTTVILQRVGENYFMQISQAYTGNQIEETLAAFMKARRLRNGISLTLQYDLVDKQWLNIDISRLFKALGINEADKDAALLNLPKNGHKAEVLFPFGDTLMTMQIVISNPQYFCVANENTLKREEELVTFRGDLKLRSDMLSGLSVSRFAREGEPPENPTIRIFIYPSGERPWRGVTEAQADSKIQEILLATGNWVKEKLEKEFGLKATQIES